MSKQNIRTTHTEVKAGEAIGTQLEQTVLFDDLSLPSPQELREYNAINPKLVEFLLEQTKKEQEHRHRLDNQKMKILENRRDGCSESTGGECSSPSSH